MKTTHTGSVPNNVGFTTTTGTVRRAITVQHTKADEGKIFVDNLGREYTHTEQGNMYHQIKHFGE